MSDIPPKPPSRQQVYTLVVQVGRRAGDGLPKGATGAGLVCYASGVDEAEAVRETVAILKQAEMAPLEVTGYGTLEERLAGEEDVPPEEQALMQRALAENAVIVAQVTPFHDAPLPTAPRSAPAERPKPGPRPKPKATGPRR